MVPSVAHICSMDPMLTSAASYGAFCCAQASLEDEEWDEKKDEDDDKNENEEEEEEEEGDKLEESPRR